MNRIVPVLIIMGSLAAGLAAADKPGEAATAPDVVRHPSIVSHVTFHYYKDLAAAEHFYRDILGLEKTYDGPWVKMFRITGQSVVGLLDEREATFRAPTTTPSVMLSIETTDLEGWNEQLKSRGAVFMKELDPESKHPLVDSIMLKDPGGYTVEFFRWKKK